MIHVSAGPAYFERFGLLARAEAEGEHQFTLRKIARAAAQHLRLRLAARRELDDSAYGVAVGAGTDQANA